jgi:hypothetical protein
MQVYLQSFTIVYLYKSLQFSSPLVPFSLALSMYNFKQLYETLQSTTFTKFYNPTFAYTARHQYPLRMLLVIESILEEYST